MWKIARRAGKYIVYKAGRKAMTRKFDTLKEAIDYQIRVTTPISIGEME